jgi:enediyne biosynthesis protein E4
VRERKPTGAVSRRRLLQLLGAFGVRLSVRSSILFNATPALPRFVDVTREAGLAAFRNTQGSERKDYILESIGGGCAFIDYDDDGWQDLLLVRGSTMERYGKGGDPICALFHNNRDGTFTDVTERSGLLKSGWAMGVAVADFNNDGWDDIYITGYGRSFLFRNNGNGTFTEIGGPAGVSGVGLWSTGAAFGDYDNDGHLDLYVTRYVHFDMKNPPRRDPSKPTCVFKGAGVYCGPRGLPGEPDALFHNNGDGTFTEVSERAGISDVQNRYYGLGVVFGDYNDDGYLDIFVGNDSTPRYLYRNNGDGTFTDVAVETGVAYSSEGAEQASMGVDLGDYDNDGLLDAFVTNFSHDTNELYRNQRDGFFDDVTWPSGVGAPSWLLLGWGTQFVDLDNDGWLDLFVANGHAYPEVDQIDVGTSYAEPLLVHLNQRGAGFKEAGPATGGALAGKYCARGAAFGDFDNDGDVDVLLNSIDRAPTLLRNDGGNKNNWLRVKTVGRTSNRNGIGCRVTISTGTGSQVREIKSGGSYLSSSELRAHFGLGDATKADLLSVRWPGGRTQVLRDVPANQTVTVREA